MTPNEVPPPRKRAWVAFALVGFVAGIMTVIVLILLVRRLRGS